MSSMMKRISVVLTASILIVWAGACDDGQVIELRDVELFQTNDGVLLVDGEGDEMLLDAQSVEVDAPLETMSSPFPLSDESTSTAAMCCSICMCSSSGCGCSNCEPCEEEEEEAENVEK